MVIIKNGFGRSDLGLWALEPKTSEGLRTFSLQTEDGDGIEVTILKLELLEPDAYNIMGKVIKSTNPGKTIPEKIYYAGTYNVRTRKGQIYSCGTERPYQKI